MNNLTAADIDADIVMLTDSFVTGNRCIPSSAKLMRKSATVPLLSIIFSLLSTIVFYVSSDKSEASIRGFWEFFITEGWYLIAITMVIGVFFFLMSYNTLMTYLTVPEELRKKSLIIRHLSSIAFKSIKTFIFLITVSALLSGVSPWFAVAIPALTLALLFVVNGIIGAEINRLGAGLALEKISKLVKKI